MSLPSELIALVERLNQELDRIQVEATEGTRLANAILNRFPDNFVVIQLLAFLNASLFFVETSRRQIQTRTEDIVASGVTDEVIQEAGEDLSIELGRVLETKIRVSNILELAREAEQKAREMCEIITNHSRKWRLKAETIRFEAVDKR
jgi:hypothetical protein